MTGWEAIALVLVAFLGAGGPVALWIATRESRRTRTVAEAVAESVGERNGHGTIQDQGVQMLSRLASIETSARAIADSVHSVSARLDGHDREIGAHKDRIAALESWQASRAAGCPPLTAPPPD